MDINNNVRITKRDGRVELWSRDKMRNVALWASNGNETFADVLLRDTEIKIVDKMPIASVFDSVITTATEKISRISPEWEFVASKLYLMKMYSESHHRVKNKKYPHLRDVLIRGMEDGIYNKDVFLKYTEKDINCLNDTIDPTQDYTFAYNPLLTFDKKYCMRLRNGIRLELPQITYMRVAMGICHNLGKEFNENIPYSRLEIVSKLYWILTKGQATLATPIMTNSMTPLDSYASCILNTIGNSTSDLMNALETAGQYTKGRGGVAFDISLIQATGSVTNNGVVSGGIVPHIRNIQSVVQSLMQCYSSDTEILTPEGFKYFKDLRRTDKVAQYDLEGKISFVDQLGYVEFPHKGKVIEYYGENTSLRVTPEHRMLKRKKDGSFEVALALDCEYNDENELIRAGNLDTQIASGVNFSALRLRISWEEKFAIAMNSRGIRIVIDGKTPAYTVVFPMMEGKQLTHLKAILSRLPQLEYKIKKHKYSKKEITVSVPEEFASHFSIYSFRWINLGNIGSSWIEEFMRELKMWNRHRYDSSITSYVSQNQEDIDKLQALATLSNRYSRSAIAESNDKDNLNLKLDIFARNAKVSSATSDEVAATISRRVVSADEHFYCVTVPSSFVVVRRDGKVSISGNSNTRRGSAVITCAWWHYEIETFLELKDASSGTEENRALHLKYSIATNDYLYHCAEADADVVLFDPIDTPLLNTTYGTEWVEAYNAYVKDTSIRRKVIKSKSGLFKKFLKFAFQTGNIYEIMLDTVNKRSMTNRYIGSSNLCAEILEPSRGGETSEETTVDKDGTPITTKITTGHEIAICNLASFNMRILDLPPEDFDDIIYIVSLVMNNTIDIGSYMRSAGKYSNQKYRYLGLGQNNTANHMAHHKIKMDDPEAQEFMYLAFQKLTNAIIHANTELARQLGRNPNMKGTKWDQGQLPYDTANHILKKRFLHLYDREADDRLRNRIKKYGIVNILMMATAPTASSANSKGLTEANDPLHDLEYQLEGSTSGRVLAPEVKELGQWYSLAYETDPKAIVINAAIRQMWIDQSQSTSIWLKKEHWSYEFMMKLKILGHKLGMKTWYYTNTTKDKIDACLSCGT